MVDRRRKNHTHQVRELNPDRVIVVDAAEMGLAPGEVRLVDDSQIAELFIMTTHNLPVSFLIERLREDIPEVIFLGIQPDVVAFSFPMSGSVRQAVEAIHARFAARRQLRDFRTNLNSPAGINPAAPLPSDTIVSNSLYPSSHFDDTPAQPDHASTGTSATHHKTPNESGTSEGKNNHTSSHGNGTENALIHFHEAAKGTCVEAQLMRRPAQLD